MKDTIKLNEIAGYLPYGLHIKHNEGTRLIICGAFKKHNRDDFFTYSLLNWDKDVKSIDAKPILRPMSDLTKEITHKGKTVILAKALWSVNAEEEEDFDTYGHVPEYWTLCIHHIENNLSRVEYGDVLSMLEYHFDIHNLIGRNLAVDINTLKD